MNTNIFLITKVIAECFYIASVTYAAIAFNKPSLLWFYVLVLFMGYSFKQSDKKE